MSAGGDEGKRCAVVLALNQLHLTRQCTHIVHLVAGRVAAQGSFAEVASSYRGFFGRNSSSILATDSSSETPIVGAGSKAGGVLPAPTAVAVVPDIVGAADEGVVRVRSHSITGNESIETVGKSQSCMVSKLPIAGICEQTVDTSEVQLVSGDRSGVAVASTAGSGGAGAQRQQAEAQMKGSVSSSILTRYLHSFGGWPWYGTC